MPLPTTFAGVSARGEGQFARKSSNVLSYANLWFSDTSTGSSEINRINYSGTLLNSYSPYPTYSANGAYGLCYGKDGNIWFNDLNNFLKINPTTGTITIVFYPSNNGYQNVPIIAGNTVLYCATKSSNFYTINYNTLAVTTSSCSPTSGGSFVGANTNPGGACLGADGTPWWVLNDGSLLNMYSPNNFSNLTPSFNGTVNGIGTIIGTTDGLVWYTTGQQYTTRATGYRGRVVVTYNNIAVLYSYDPSIGYYSITSTYFDYNTTSSSNYITPGGLVTDGSGKFYCFSGDTLGNTYVSIWNNNTSTLTSRAYTVPSSGVLKQMVFGTDGNIWGADPSGTITMMTTSGTFTVYRPLYPNASAPAVIMQGP